MNRVLNDDSVICDWCYDGLSGMERELPDNLVMGLTPLPCSSCDYDGETPGVDMSLAQLRELMVV